MNFKKLRQALSSSGYSSCKIENNNYPGCTLIRLDGRNEVVLTKGLVIACSVSEIASAIHRRRSELNSTFPVWISLENMRAP